MALLKHHLTLFAFLIICIYFSSEAYAKKSPIKYGKPDIEDLKMTTYASDSTAEAVILCNYGYFNSNEFEFVQTIRIKILNKNGTRWGSRSYLSLGQDVRVRGKTFNLEGEVVVEDKLKSESIFKKRYVGQYYTVNVAMPNVKTGSVIDIEVVTPGLPREWKFQELIPVMWSELMVESSEHIEFQKNFFGYLPLDKHSPNHWIASNVPAFKIEPYMDSYKNYISKIEFDIRRVTYHFYREDFASTWEKVGETLLDDKYFGDVINSACGFLKDLAKEIEGKCSSDMDKLKMAFERIKIIKWNDIKSYKVSNGTLGTIYKEKIGNSAEINLLLLKLLDHLGLKAYPVVLSTRDNGQLSMISPSLNKLNYVICCIDVNGERFLLDPTEEKLPLGFLPERAINNKGRVIYSKEKTEWVSLGTKKVRVEQTFSEVKLNIDNSIIGKRTASFMEYGAYKKRKELEEFNSDDDYIADYETKFPGLKINRIEIKNKDDIYSKLVEMWDVKLTRCVESIGDILMINLHLIEQEKENQFKLDERVYPVNYPYTFSKSNTVSMELPDGYEISELPKVIRLVLPDGGGMFVQNYLRQGNKVILTSKITISKNLFLPNEYPYLKEFFVQVIKKQAEPIIVKKI